MNERIKELEKRCWNHRVDGVLVDGHLHFDTRKFAELIIRECIAVVEPSGYRRAYPENYKGGIDCLEILDERVFKIKEHFGVEE